MLPAWRVVAPDVYARRRLTPSTTRNEVPTVARLEQHGCLSPHSRVRRAICPQRSRPSRIFERLEIPTSDSAPHLSHVRWAPHFRATVGTTVETTGGLLARGGGSRRSRRSCPEAQEKPY